MLLSDFEIDKRYLAHTSRKEDVPDETLIEHSNLTRVYVDKIVKAKNLVRFIYMLLEKVDSKNLELLEEMFYNTIYLHDIGKKNPHFQAKKMCNPHGDFDAYRKSTESSNHSALSADMFIDYYLKKIASLSTQLEREKYRYLLYVFSYHQAKHHGKLGAFKEYREDENAPKNYWKYLKKFDIPEFEFYILNKLLFSLLVSSDYYATTEYMAGFSIDEFGILSDDKKVQLQKMFSDYLEQFQNPGGINKLRSEMFKEAEGNLLKNLDKNIYYLEAPTGSGKTITSISLALQLLQKDRNLNKLFYVFPFNTLVEQTKNVFEEIFGVESIEVINSITPIKEVKDQEYEETKYEKAYINRLFFHAPAIITTHVALFDILFGTSKEDNFPLWQLANSVIILDEIQAYNNQLWWYMAEFFDKYATLLNIKIIIMSATLPKLDKFLERQDSFVSLVKKRDYFFEHPLFRDRVVPDFSYLSEKMTFEKLQKLLSKQPKDKKILFEFIKKQSAREFYELIKDDYENVYELSGDDNKAYRQFVINKSREARPIIIIATQVIEAGVDIDMDIGFKDISTIDGEEQFMGRINRSCKRSGIVYFFDMDEAEKIYKGDHRLGLDLKQPKYQEILQGKNFHEYYEKVLANIQNDGNRFENGFLTKHEEFEELIKKLNYRELAKKMTLIDSQNFTLYFPFKIDISAYQGVKEFEEIEPKILTDGWLDGQKLWDEFKALDEIANFTQRAFEKSKINALMQFFTFNILRFQGQEKPPFFSEEYGGFYFIDDLSFMADEGEGKFDRARYLKTKEEIFI